MSPSRSAPGVPVRAYSPGRVNLIGDHTDYNDGLALPMAVDLGTTVSFVPDLGGRVTLLSRADPALADVDLHVALDPAALQATQPPWARLVAGAVAVVRPDHGGRGVVDTTLPIGAGLSSSAALVVATALALGLDADGVGAARACQRAEQAATGVRGGIMDQLVVCTARPGHALLVDFTDLATRHVALPDDVEVVVVHSGTTRALDTSAYGTRRAECEAAAVRLGPLGHVDVASASALPDPLLRRRARHVASECERVRQAVAALEAGDAPEVGRLMTASHHSLARDFEVSTAALDDLVRWLGEQPGVFGARLTGAGFGGCAVALTEPGALAVGAMATPSWRVRASGCASVDRGPSARPRR